MFILCAGQGYKYLPTNEKNNCEQILQVNYLIERSLKCQRVQFQHFSTRWEKINPRHWLIISDFNKFTEFCRVATQDITTRSRAKSICEKHSVLNDAKDNFGSIHSSLVSTFVCNFLLTSYYGVLVPPTSVKSRWNLFESFRS